MSWQTIVSIVSLLVSVGTLVAILIGWGWWIGKVDTTIAVLKDANQELKDALERFSQRDDLFVRKIDYTEQVANRNREIADLWKSQNELRDKFNDCRANKACQAKG